MGFTNPYYYDIIRESVPEVGIYIIYMILGRDMSYILQWRSIMSVYKKEKKLTEEYHKSRWNSPAAEATVELAAVSLFAGNCYAAEIWLNTPLIELGNESPIDHAQTSVGEREVLKLIRDIKYGISS